MKDRDGNKPAFIAGAKDAVARLQSSCGDVTTSDGKAICNSGKVAQFVAGEVTKEMCWNVFEDCDGCEKNMAETARHWLDRWRKELGPALGLVTREEMARSVEIRDTEIARLETDLELARRDAERYRWIRDSDNEGPISAGNATAFGEYGFERVEWFYDDELDAAVDEARAGNGGEA